MSFVFVTVTARYLNVSTFSYDKFPITVFWFCITFWWWDMIIYLVFLEFTPEPMSLLAFIFCIFHNSLLTYWRHQHKQAADISHSIPKPMLSYVSILILKVAPYIKSVKLCQKKLDSRKTWSRPVKLATMSIFNGCTSCITYEIVNLIWHVIERKLLPFLTGCKNISRIADCIIISLQRIKIKHKGMQFY